MAHTVPFDTLAFAKELESAGVPTVQAEAHAKVMLVTLQKMEESRLQELATKGDVELAKAELRRDIAENKAEIIRWMVGLALAQLAMMAGILMTLLRVLH